MTGVPAFGGIASALGHRDYRLYSIGAGASYLGTWVYRTGLGWFTWELTESTAWLGIVVFTEVLPIICLVPLTGALVDRLGALKIAKLTQIIAASVMTVLAALTAVELMTIELLLVLVFLNGTTMSLMQASYFSLVASLVPRQDLSSAVAFQSSLVQTARFIGPAIAGALLVLLGTSAAFALNAISYIALLIALFALDYRDPAERPSGGTSLVGDIAQGFGYIINQRTIRTLLLLTIAFSLLLRPVIELMPGFASEVFGRGAEGLAWFLSIAGLGAIFGSLWIARRGRAEGLTRLMALTAILSGVALLAFAQTTAFWLAIALMAIYGLASNINSICSQILIQNVVDPSLRARVMSLVGLTFRAVPAASAALLGSVAVKWGLSMPISIVAILGVLGGFWVLALIRTSALDERAERKLNLPRPAPAP